MTASEFAFLALGLVLGAACGAALVEVLRSRPPSRREVRVTVAPNSIPRRASTLAESDTTDSGPARGGPADRRWVDRDMPPADEADPWPAGIPIEPVPPAAALRAADGAPVDDRTAVPSSASQPPFRLTTTEGLPVGGQAVASPKPSVGIPIAREPDPMVTALRATAAASATAAMKQTGAPHRVPGAPKPTGPAAPTAADEAGGEDGPGAGAGGGGDASGGGTTEDAG